MKNTLVVSHERSGTHLLINIINAENHGNFKSIGIEASLKNDIFNSVYDPTTIFKSHHQVQFFEPINNLFEKFKIIYVKRDIKDVLTSYYYFINQANINTPTFENWIFSEPEKNISDFNQSKTEKDKIEKYLNKKILDKIPDVNDTNFLSFSPKFGIVGSHKTIMSKDLIKKIDDIINL